MELVINVGPTLRVTYLLLRLVEQSNKRRLSVHQPTYVPVHQSFFHPSICSQWRTPTRKPAFLSVCAPNYLLRSLQLSTYHVPTYTSISIYLSIYLSTRYTPTSYLPACFPACLYTYLPACLHTYLFTYLRTYLFIYLSQWFGRA
jgi:hypothetical protein